MECKLCNLCENCTRPIAGKSFLDNGASAPEIMLIGDFPKREDISSGRPFSDKLGIQLANLINTSKLPADKVYITHLVKCRPVAPNGLDGRLKIANVQACQVHLIEEIATVNPKLIILFGDAVFRYFYPKESFSDNRGKILTNNQFGIPTIATYHPQAMLATAKFDQIINTDLAKAYSFLYGGEQETQKPQKDYRLVTKSLKLLENIAKRVKEVPTFAFDIETHGEGLFNYKLLSLGLSWKKDTGVSIPVWVLDNEKVDKIQAAINYVQPERFTEETVILKSGKTKIKKTKNKEWLKEDDEALKAILPEEYKDLVGTCTFRELKLKLGAILDKEPPLKKYWGDQHEHCMALIKEIMECDTPKGAHNGSYDVNRLRGIGINVKNYAWDTILEHHLLDEERPHGLDDLSFVYTKDGGYKSGKNVYLKSTKTSWANIPMEVLLPYNAQDADVTFQLHEIFVPKIKESEKRWKLYMNHIMPAQRMLCDMEFRGSNIDVAWVQKTKKEYLTKMNDLKIKFSQLVEKVVPNIYVVDSPAEQKDMELQIKERAKQEGTEPKFPFFLNMNSTQQLLVLFRDYYKVTLTKKTKSGDALDSDVLKKIAKKNKAAEVLLEYKKLKKLESTYLSATLERIDVDNKLHTEFLLYGTACVDGELLMPTERGFIQIKELDPQVENTLVENNIHIINQYGNQELATHVVKYSNVPTITLHIEGMTDFTGTYNHPVLCAKPAYYGYNEKTGFRNKEFKRLEDIRAGDYVEVGFNYDLLPKTQVKTGLVSREVHTTGKHGIVLPDTYTEDFAEFIGMYMADGTISTSNGTFNIKITNDCPHVQARIQELSKKVFNLDTRKVCTAAGSHDTVLTSAALFPLQSILPIGAYNKVAPTGIKQSPISVLIAYIRGRCLDATYFKNEQKIKISVKNKIEANLIQQVLFACGIPNCIIKQKNTGNPPRVLITTPGSDSESYYRIQIAGINCKRFYEIIRPIRPDLHVCGPFTTSASSKVSYTHRGALYRVKGITYGTGDVYDIHVPKTHSFICHGIKNHNTSRLSSRNPNLQNVSSSMKTMFIPPSKDYLCVNVDQSAAELHVLSALAQDKKMIDIFENHRDLHRETAASVFGKKMEDITDEERKIAKRVSFGTAYSISGKGLAELLEPEGVKITENQGNKFIEKWRDTYKACARYLDNASKNFTRYGYLETPFGRRRHKYKNYADSGREASAARQACNFPIQSTASDIQVYEMVHMYKTLVDNGVLPVFTVHDSIVMYCPKSKLRWLRDYYKRETCRRFSNAEFPGLNNCLMYTEMEVGRNYGEHVKLPYDCDFEEWKKENAFLFGETNESEQGL